MSRVHLTGLTKEQCDMLDILWTLDTKEKFFEYFETLNEDQMSMCLTLQEMVLQEMAETNSGYSPDTAKNMLRKIGVKV